MANVLKELIITKAEATKLRIQADFNIRFEKITRPSKLLSQHQESTQEKESERLKSVD